MERIDVGRWVGGGVRRGIDDGGEGGKVGG